MARSPRSRWPLRTGRLKGPTVDSNIAAVVVPEFRLHFCLRERQAVVDFRALGLGKQHIGEALEGLDGRDRILFGDVRENRAIQPLRIGLASNRQDLARQYDAPEGDHANQYHARKHFVQSAHTALLTVRSAACVSLCLEGS